MKKNGWIPRKWILLIVLCFIGFSSFLFSKEVSNYKNQLLFEAVASENLTEIKRLLDLGADPNSECPNEYYYVINIYDKCTLWDVVIRENLHRTLSLLLKGGLKEKYVGGALDSAAEFQRLEIAKILIQHGFKKDQGHALEFASTHCNLSMLRLLLKAGLDPNTSKDWVDMYGSSIAGSFRKDCVPVAVELIQAGADVNKDPKLMIWAARSGAKDVYFVLKKTNVKFDVKTVLQEAKKGYENIEKMIKIWDGPYGGLPEESDDEEEDIVSIQATSNGPEYYNSQGKRVDYDSVKERELKYLNIRLEKYNDIIKDLESILKNRK